MQIYYAVTRLRHSKQPISITVLAHATEKHVTSASTVTSRNNRRAAWSGVATPSGTSRKVPLWWNKWYHATQTKKGTFFAGSAPTTRPSELSWFSGVQSRWFESRRLLDSGQPVRTWARKQRTLLGSVTRQPVNTADWEDLSVCPVVNVRVWISNSVTVTCSYNLCV
jgi:hypothetical protein